jgi:hypothetical protein
MSTVLRSFRHLSNQELLAEVQLLVQRDRQATVQLIASLIELDVRRLYLGEGYSSLFTFCTQVLRLSEHAAYGRIEAARAARRFPVILNLLDDGAITLTTVGLLARHLTPDNHVTVLESARPQEQARGRADRRRTQSAAHRGDGRAETSCTQPGSCFLWSGRCDGAGGDGPGAAGAAHRGRESLGA